MATIGTYPIKILAQFGDGEPVHIGTYHMDVKASSPDENGAVKIDASGFSDWVHSVAAMDAAKAGKYAGVV